MSNKNQFVKEFVVAGLFTFFKGIYSGILVDKVGIVKTLGITIGSIFKELLSENSVDKTALANRSIGSRSFEYNKLSAELQFLSFRTGLVFVFNSLPELNTSKDSLRP